MLLRLCLGAWLDGKFVKAVLASALEGAPLNQTRHQARCGTHLFPCPRPQHPTPLSRCQTTTPPPPESDVETSLPLPCDCPLLRAFFVFFLAGKKPEKVRFPPSSPRLTPRALFISTPFPSPSPYKTVQHLSHPVNKFSPSDTERLRSQRQSLVAHSRLPITPKLPGEQTSARIPRPLFPRRLPGPRAAPPNIVEPSPAPVGNKTRHKTPGLTTDCGHTRLSRPPRTGRN